MSARSPKSWVSSLRYGVSPQPAQAPENSNSGSRNCESLTSSCRSRRAVGLGQVEEEVEVLALGVAQRRLRRHVDAPCAAGSPCPWPGRPRRRARSRCSPRARPGACTRSPRSRRRVKASDLNVGGAARRAPGSIDLGADRGVRADQRALVALDAELGSQTGISAAMLRFSHCAVPVGQVPSTGKALTGSRSPLPAIISAVTRCTKSGASVGHDRRPRAHARSPPPGTGPRGGARASRRRPRSCVRTTSAPRLAVGLLDRLLDLRDRLLARQHAGDREEAGLHDRVDAAAHARVARHRGRRRSRRAAARFSMICSCTSRGRWSQTSSGPYGAFSRNTAPGAACSQHVERSRNANWWQATKLAGGSGRPSGSGRGPKRRCEIVTAPDFFES